MVGVGVEVGGAFVDELGGVLVLIAGGMVV